LGKTLGLYPLNILLANERVTHYDATKIPIDPLSNAIAMKLIDSKLVETTNKNALEEQIKKCLEKLGRADEFEIDYQVAPIRNTVPQPHVVSLFLTAFVIEKLIKHKDVVDIFGSDEDIYLCIHQQVKKFLPA
jgi:hypothetical protein